MQELRDAMSVSADTSYCGPPECATLPLGPTCREKCALKCIIGQCNCLVQTEMYLQWNSVHVPRDSAVYEFHEYKFDRM